MQQWTLDEMPDQGDKTVLITGASSGIGLESAIEFAQRGARVVMACRPGDKAERALDRVAESAHDIAPQLVALDLADLSSVRACAHAVNQTEDRIDVLMLNAGVMAVPRSKTVDGFESHFGTNHLGHFALAGLLMPLVLASPEKRVVTTSSLAHWSGRIRWNDPNWTGRFYSPSLAYGQSKLGNLLFMRELDRRARAADLPLVSTAAHPGIAHTNLAHEHNNIFSRLFFDGFRRLGAQPADLGALPLLYAATVADVPGGSYWGPNGRLEVHGHPTRANASPAARDDAAAARLWALSTELTGVDWEDTMPNKASTDESSTEGDAR